MCGCRDECASELSDLQLRLKLIDSQQRTLMSNIDEDVYLAVKHVYNKVSHYSHRLSVCLSVIQLPMKCF